MLTEFKSSKRSNYFRFFNSPSNCKLTYWEYASSSLYGTTEEVLYDVKEFLSFPTINIIVAVNVHTEKDMKFLIDNFQVYSCNKIPVGYNDGFQYHIIIRNHYSKKMNIALLRPLSEAGVEKLVDNESLKKNIIEDTTKKIKAKLIDVLNTRKFLTSTKKFIVSETFEI